MLDRFFKKKDVPSFCFCTLAIHEQYRRRAHLLCSDAPTVPWIVLTDEPDDFADLTVKAISHQPVGPMAIDFLTNLPPLGHGLGRPAYHDKRFVLQAALEEFDTAIFVDADSRLRSIPRLPVLPTGMAAASELQTNIDDHLNKWGAWRRPAFEDLARALTGSLDILRSARWCGEWLFSVTKDGLESKFFETWSYAAEFLQTREVFSGEGGVIGLAAAIAGWKINYRALAKLEAVVQHEGQGHKIWLKSEV
jgi:hypothetical protein